VEVRCSQYHVPDILVTVATSKFTYVICHHSVAFYQAFRWRRQPPVVEVAASSGSLFYMVTVTTPLLTSHSFAFLLKASPFTGLLPCFLAMEGIRPVCVCIIYSWYAGLIGP
jgi:hypothetical protein